MRLRKPTAPAKAADSDEIRNKAKYRALTNCHNWLAGSVRLQMKCISSAKLGAVSGQTDSAMLDHQFGHKQLSIRQTKSICKPAKQF